MLTISVIIVGAFGMGETLHTEALTQIIVIYITYYSVQHSIAQPHVRRMISIGLNASLGSQNLCELANDKHFRRGGIPVLYVTELWNKIVVYMG